MLVNGFIILVLHTTYTAPNTFLSREPPISPSQRSPDLLEMFMELCKNIVYSENSKCDAVAGTNIDSFNPRDALSPWPDVEYDVWAQ